MSDSLQPHGLQHASTPTPRACSDSCPSSQWCLPLCPPSPPASVFPSIRVFSNKSVFASGGQSIGASASASALPKNTQEWFLLGLTGLISLQSKGLSRVFSNTTVQKHQFFGTQLSLWSDSNIHTRKTIALTRRTFVSKVMSLLFNMLSRFVTAFLPRSKRLLISSLQSPSAVILRPKKIKSLCFHCFPICLPWSDRTGCHDLHFLNAEFMLCWVLMLSINQLYPNTK